MILEDTNVDQPAFFDVLMADETPIAVTAIGMGPSYNLGVGGVEKIVVGPGLVFVEICGLKSDDYEYFSVEIPRSMAVVTYGIGLKN